MSKLSARVWAADVPAAVEQFCKIAAQAKVEIIGNISYDATPAGVKVDGSFGHFCVDLEAEVK